MFQLSDLHTKIALLISKKYSLIPSLGCLILGFIESAKLSTKAAAKPFAQPSAQPSAKPSDKTSKAF